MVAFCLVLDEALSCVKINKKIVFKALNAVVVGIFAFLIPLYANITVMNNQVNEYIDYQIEQGKKSVYICVLTNTDYFHHSYAVDRLGYDHYRKVPKDVEFVIIAQNSWLDYYYKDGAYKTTNE